MARPSLLTERQKAEISKRILAGDTHASIAKDFKVSRALVSGLVPDRVNNIKNAGVVLAEAMKVVQELPINDRAVAETFADDLLVSGNNLAKAARTGSAISVRLSDIAHHKVERLGNDCETEDLRVVAALADVAHKNSQIATALLTANKGKDTQPGVINVYTGVPRG